MRKFYYEYDSESNYWDVYESDGGQESGQKFDTYAFTCSSEEDAIEAVDLLHELQQH